MSHVTTETATVYRCAETRRRYYSKRWAYYAQAKAMVRAKYPNPIYEDAVGYYEEHEERERKREALFHVFTDEWAPHGQEPGPQDYFCGDKWQRFIDRLARFLRYVDES